MAILKKINTKIIIISVLVFLILVLALLKIFTPKKPTPSLVSPSPSGLPNSEHFVLPSPATQAAEKNQKGDPLFYQEIDKKLEKRFPLYSYLPYQTSTFSVKYLGPLKLEVEVASESGRTQILEWIKSKGIDPATHQIIYK